MRWLSAPTGRVPSSEMWPHFAAHLARDSLVVRRFGSWESSIATVPTASNSGAVPWSRPRHRTETARGLDIVVHWLGFLGLEETMG